MTEFEQPQIRDYVLVQVVRAFPQLGPVNLDWGPKLPGMAVIERTNRVGQWVELNDFNDRYTESGLFGFEHAFWLVKQGYECTRTSWPRGFLLWTAEGLAINRENKRHPGARPWRPSYLDLSANDWRLTHVGARKARP